MAIAAWEQQPDESAEAYAGFRTYLQCGTGRTLDQAYQQAGRGEARPGRNGGTSAPRASGTWRRWYKANRWQARALAWDNRTVRVEQAAREQVIAKHAASDQERQERQRQREEALLGGLYDKLQAMMQFGLARKVEKDVQGRVVTIFEPTKWDFGTLINGIQLFAKAGRVHAQMPTVVLDNASSGHDDLFVDSSGQLADVVPEGALPGMPEDAAVAPEIGATITRESKGLIQPSQPARPTPDDLQPPKRRK